MASNRVPISAVVKPDQKTAFVALTSKNDMTVSEAIERLIIWANKTGKIPK